MLRQPALDARMLVHRVTIADEIDFLAGRDSLINHGQEARPFLIVMPVLEEPIEFADCRSEVSEQWRRAVALVVARHGGAATLLHRQARLGAVRRQDLALLVHSLHRRVLRWI